MAAKSFLQLNQLQFNLNAPPTANNLIYKQRKPKPIQIERVSGPSNKQNVGTPTTNPHDNSLQFSVISEDRLSAAVILAKRDLKNQKIAEEMRANQLRSSPPHRGRSRTKIEHSKQGVPTKKKLGSGKPTTKMKDNTRNTAGQARTPPKSKVNPVHLPATTNSPPTRDTDRYPIHKVRIPISNPDDDIIRMQKELECYLNQIKTIEETAITDENTEFLNKRRGRSIDGYLSDEEDVDRKVVRSDEQLVRTARSLYNLRQQVRQIQNDFLQLDSNDIKHTKKSQAVSKLTAAHRGAVRSMQAFVHQLPHQDLRHGLPSSYRELALLIRQLTMLNTQIQRGEDNSANNQLINLLDRVDELNQVWCSDIRGHNTSKHNHNTSSASVRPPFILDFNHHKPAKLHQKFYGKENKTRDILKRSGRKDIGMKKPVNHYRAGSPVRKAALRAGIASILKPNEGGKKPSVAFDIPIKSRTLGHKGSLILPGHLQNKRAKINRLVQPVICDSHFADPTIAANLKATSYLSNPILDQRPSSAPSSPTRHKELGFSPSRHHKAPWIPPGSPKSLGCRSPSSERRSQSHSPHSSRRYQIEDVDNSIIKRLFPDKDGNQLQLTSNREQIRSTKTSRPRSISPRPHSRSPTTSRSPRRRALSDSLIEDIADEVRRKLRLNVQDDDRLYKSYPESARAKKILRRSEEDLTEVILDDVLRDTVLSLKQIDTRDKIHQKAVTMQDSPTVENIFYRLQQMEEEQEDIRRRWASVSFHDPRPKTKYFTSNEILSDRPRSPPAIQVSCSRKTDQIVSSFNTHRSVAFSQEIIAEPVIFTKQKTTPKWTQSYKHSEFSNDDFDGEPLTIPLLSRPKKHITVPQTIVSKIEDNRENFQHFLKKKSHHPMGKFDPWKLVEDITDKILDECLLDVALELDDLNEDMADHMYKSEFLLANGQSPGTGKSDEKENGVISEVLTDGWDGSQYESNEEQSNDF